MAGSENPLTVREAVLLVVSAAGGEIDGRTAAQKLCYFAGGAINQDLGHRAHYFGPYSRYVENALGNSAFAGDIEETVRLFDSARIDSGRAYRYTLTDQGNDAVKELRAEHPEQAAKIDRTVQQLGELVEGYRQHPLSLAAKVDLIVQQQSRERGRFPAADLPGMAKQLGWNLSDEDVNDAVGILVAVGRVMKS